VRKLKNQKADRPVIEDSQWIGLSEEHFARYKNWKTPSGNLCGTYAAAVLLAYYQDQIDEHILPKEIRKKAGDRRVLIDFLQACIQPAGYPTIPFQVSRGLKKLCQTFQLPYSPRSTSIGSWQRATKRIMQGKPVILGVLRVLGSTYGNHWVVAYAYTETASGERFYKVHDNWGNYRQVIPASWANGTVSFT
jgi:hypothetical protein